MWQSAFIVLLPIFSLLALYILLRIVYPPPAAMDPSRTPKYGTLPTHSLKQISTLSEGEVAGDYEADWKTTFDYVFFIAMFLFFILLCILTALFESHLFYSPSFWLLQIPKLATMIGVSLLGGLICRKFCQVDVHGYIITNKSSKFKVNYTRKLQHFAAYMVPLVISSTEHGPLALAWGDFFTMIGFLVLIKPVRESCDLFMMQFNSLVS